MLVFRWGRDVKYNIGIVKMKLNSSSGIKGISAISLIFFLVFTVTLISFDAYADNKLTFGSFGATGYDGEDGRDGISGQDLTVSADGRSANYELSGTDGSSGSYGDDGEDAYSCYQPDRPHRNVRAASGGDGGDGGYGGAGGDGGNLTILYNDIEELKRIRVVARGGVGADGGQGGRGGRPCTCEYDYWTHEECKNEKQSDGSSKRVCKNVRKSCVGGSSGSRGSRGPRGRAGKMGSVYLVKGVDNWEPNNILKVIPLGELHDTTHTLIEHIFTEKSGAQTLLAANSIVNEKYYEYESTERETISLKWETERPASELSYLNLELTKVDDSIDYVIKDALTFYEVQEVPERTLAIKQIVSNSEALNLVFSVEGEGPESKIVLEDSFESSNNLQGKISMKLSTKRLLFGWKQQIDRELEPSEFERIGGRYLIELGKFGLKKKFLKPGKRLKIELKVTRSLGEDFVDVDFLEEIRLEPVKKKSR